MLCRVRLPWSGRLTKFEAALCYTEIGDIRNNLLSLNIAGTPDLRVTDLFSLCSAHGKGLAVMTAVDESAKRTNGALPSLFRMGYIMTVRSSEASK